MSTTTLTPSSDFADGSAWSKNGFSGTYAAALSDGSDSTFGSVSSSVSGVTGQLFLNLSAIPGNVTAITAAQISLRCKVSSTKGSSVVKASAGTNVNNTSLTTAGSFTPTTSFSTITLSVTLNDSTIADWSGGMIIISSPGDGNGNTLSVSEASVILTVTLSSAPGTPTGLVASNAGPNSVALAWVQGSGTVTDDPIEYGEDGSNFGSSVDPGSAVTSYTITGLTYGQLYFFRVAAENTNGTSAYTAPVPWVCGSNFTGQVGASNQDAFQNSSGAVTVADSTDTLAASDYLGFLIENVALAQDADIVQANVYVYLASASGIAGSVAVDCQLPIAGTFSATSDNISNRTLTGNSVTWAIGSLSTGWNQSPNIAGAVAAVVDAPLWSSLGSVAPILTGLSGAAGFDAEMWDGNPVQAAILAVFTATTAQFEGPIGSTIQFCMQAASQSAQDQIEVIS